MSKITKWKPEKTKVKVVFRLQFHATHIPQPGWDKLSVTFIPAESVKVTAKTNKANVRNGNCKWSDPIYETTRLLQDARTKKYDEKLYKLVVAMGSSRSSFLGEAIINLANYAEASKPSSVALPLQGCNSGTVLHVTVQLLTSKTGFREFEQQRELREKGFQTINDQSVHAEPAEKEASAMETEIGHIEKVNARVRVISDSRELSSLEEELNEDCTDSAVGIDGSSYTSESLYAEKHDISCTHEVDSLKSTISGELGGPSLSQSPQPQKGDQCDPRLLAQGSSDWVHGWSSDYSMDNDLTIAYEENSRLRGSLEIAESSISELKVELSTLQNHADELGAETQRFAQEFAAEIASGKELAKEVSFLKYESSKLKNDFEELKHSKQSEHFASMGVKLFSKDVPWVSLNDTDEGTSRIHNRDPSVSYSHARVPPVGEKRDLLQDGAFDRRLGASTAGKVQDCFSHNLKIGWLDALLLMEDQVREIQKKVCFRYHETDLGFLQPDLEALESVLRVLKEESTHINEEQYHSAGMLQSLSRPHQAAQGPDCREIENKVSSEATDAMKGKICELLNELEESKAEQESLMKKMDQMECYYESLIQELEESQKQVGGDLQNLRTEHATCLYTVSTYNNQMETMRQDMNEQFLRSAEDRLSLETLNKELEKRALASEAALKRLRWNYSIAVDQLQKDLELLSFQVLSMFETNESLARQAFAEASQLCFQESVEHSEGLHSFLKKDDPVTPFLAEVHTNLQGIQVVDNLPRRTELELSSKLNGPTEKLGDKMKNNEDHTVENKSISLRDCSMHAETICLDDMGTVSKVQENDTQEGMVKEVDAGMSCLNLVKVGRRIAPLQIAIQEKNLLVSNSLSLNHPKNTIPISCSVLKSKLQSQEPDVSKSLQCQNQNADAKEWIGEKYLLEEMKLQEELRCKAEAELSEMHFLNLQLVVFSKVLHETLHELNSGIRIMKKKVDELAQQLENSAESKEMLMHKLQTALDDVQSLKESEEKCMTKCNDFSLKNHTLEAKIQGISDENYLLTQKVTEFENLIMEFRNYKNKYEACATEKDELENLLKQESLEKRHLKNEISSVVKELKTLQSEFDRQSSKKTDLETSIAFLQNKLRDLRSCFDSFSEQISGPSPASKSLPQETEDENFMNSILYLEKLQERVCDQIIQLIQEKKDIEKQRSIALGSLSSTESQILLIKQQFESELHDMVTKLDTVNRHVEKLQLELQDVGHKYKRSSEAEEKYAAQNRELSSRITSLENELQRATSENRDLAQKILDFDSVSKELDITKLTVVDHTQENKALTVALQASNEECVQLASELSILKENLKCARDELEMERGFRDELEGTISNLNSQLNGTHDQMLAFSDQKAELVYLRQQVADLKLENSKVGFLLLQSEGCCRKGVEDASLLRLQVTDLEMHLAAMDEHLLVVDIEAIFAETQFLTRMQELHGQIRSLERSNEELQLKHMDILTTLEGHMASEACYIGENSQLMTALQSLRSELDTIVNEKRELVDYVDKKRAMWAELDNYKAMEATVEADNNKEKHRHEVEVEHLEGMLVCLEEEIENLRSSRDELEITVIVLRSKVDEQGSQILLLRKQGDELIKMQNQHDQLTSKLSEQMSRTEEFKNLCVQLKELKDKADAECLLAREKKETETLSVDMQESLRIAFIREQCETKLQDVRSQLYFSKKHGEEMLLKLQDALDETENRKKNEASHAKRNQELSMKILELEAELQKALSDKREMVKVNDRMKAELECSMISLDCCKEEKLELEASLHECNDERNKISIELDSVKEKLERFTSANIQVQDPQPNARDSMFIEPPSEVDLRDSEVEEALTAGTYFLWKNSGNMVNANEVNEGDSPKFSLNANTLSSCHEMEDALQDSIEGKHSSPLMKLKSSKDSLVSRSGLNVSSTVLQQQDQLQNDMNDVALINEHFKEHSLRSSMERLNKQLESLKNDNLASVLQHDEHHSMSQGLQSEFFQLHTANERLGSMFPLFNEFSGSGNALERVLALEIELAESLQAKKKSTFNFQSSFLKQHNDEQAVFQSFRDINELIKDMLEVKSRYASVETELKDMQERYSQLSLQFAEVEGERQQLLMTLKNIRLPKKP
ncbi:hypothetical protein AAC387_Pa01g0129 [Persea americana]|eukprot:TRINITY_DN3026_c1_g2_i1.p1 TRINITY_DN3026_c1_g2~~TRINITY_DN3026_c1_g2_i1.p1  ORF type:complete len:2112 (+),score=526.00 TRINITY_DN3026_c1_g2_i1:129-6464(+)